MDGYSLSIHVVSCAVVPDPSDRTTGVIGRFGNARPLLSLVIAGSFQLVIWLVKIFVSVSPESRRLRTSSLPTLSW